jgi:triosephosphate isomerase
MFVRRPLVVANWKLNGDLTLIGKMSAALNGLSDTTAEMVVCPSYPYLGSLSASKVKFSIGAQNMSQYTSGAFTGEVSASMLSAFDVKYVILGHSERRAIFGESNVTIAEKFALAVEHGVHPILCVGETEEQRNNDETQAVIGAQVKAVMDKVGVKAFTEAVIAYEPVWAIGTGKTATSEMAQQVHQFIRQQVASQDQQVADTLPILYGGSVNAGNAKELFAQADIDGGLVGGASLKVEEFLAIGRSV